MSDTVNSRKKEKKGEKRERRGKDSNRKKGLTAKKYKTIYTDC